MTTDYSTATVYPSDPPRRLDASTMVVIGEGLAAGLGDFSLSSPAQAGSFPAQMARQMGVAFRQPLFQPPGLGHAPGFAGLAAMVPALMQTTVFEALPQTYFSNLSVPEFTLSDALQLRPLQPMIHRSSVKQTLANLILSPLAIVHGKGGALPTQIECAVKQSPTFAIVELGYYDAIDAAIQANASLMPDTETVATQLGQLVSSLREAGAEVLLLNIPDPADSALFSSVSTAARILKVPPSYLAQIYQLADDDHVSVDGLSEMGFQLLSGNIDQLPRNALYGGGILREISSRVCSWNESLARLGQQPGVLVYDLHALFKRIAADGFLVGARMLSGDFLGGFYALNGCYPGATGHAIIADELLCLLGRYYGTAVPALDLAGILGQDPTAACRPAGGPDWSTQDRSTAPRSRTSDQTWMSAETAPPPRARSEHARWGVPNLTTSPAQQPLQLPAGLTQTLSLNGDTSYVGDAFLMLNCPQGSSSQFGSCAAQLFSGLAMTDSHLQGFVRIDFAPPVDGVTQFTVSLGNGLSGEDTALTAPHFYRFPLLNTRVTGVPNQLATGALNLTTGEVSNLSFDLVIVNTGLMALASVNPGFPRQPVSFPGQYGSAWAKFDQRADGNLDFSFHGSTFLPLGDGFGAPLRLPLPFAGPSMEYASIPCRGTVLHPHLHLSTKDAQPPPEPDDIPEIPCNTVREFTLFTHNSSFGDTFTLDSPQLGGPATGRSQILGRVQIQFGARSGNTVPMAIYAMNPGGIFAEFPASPISQLFPGRFSPGPQGFNEFLRFPLRTYPLDDVTFLSDPFEIAVGAVDIRSGRIIDGLLHRGFISQDLFFALLRVEPRTPKQSFFFRGPALFQQGPEGQLVFRFAGTVLVPYPEGFLFPEPDLATGIPIGAASRLDPFLWIHAMHGDVARGSVARGDARNVIASTGESFSYAYEVPAEGREGKASFHYENHTQQGSFELRSLAWVSFSNSGSSPSAAEFDTVTFSGFGIWTKDGISVLRQAAAQISTSPAAPYVAIQIDSGAVSNVNTKPPELTDVLP